MGAEPWDYFVPYEPDIQAALEKLRQREFEAGRFRGSELGPGDAVEAFANTGADGTASILDMLTVGPGRDFCTVAPLSKEELLRLFGTERPTRAMVERSPRLYEDIERGQGVYVVCFRDGEPAEIFFGGYSFD
jgi:hypothetical protein